MSAEQVLTVIASGAIATIVSLIVQLVWQSRFTVRQVKIDCLRRVVAHRSAPASREFAAALNEIYVTYNQSREVIERMKVFQRHINTTGGHSNDLLLDLIKAMMKDLDMKYDQIDDALLLSKINSI